MINKSKILILSLFFLIIGSVFCQTAEKINWMSFNEALAAQKKNPKPIMVDFYTVWCGPCKMLDKFTFSNKDLIKYVNDKLYAVKFNSEGDEVVNYNGILFKNDGYKKENAEGRNSTHDLTAYVQIQAYPTILFLNETGEAKLPVTGFYQARELEPVLKFFGEGHHKNINSQEEFDNYMKDFKSTFAQNK